MFRPLPEGLVLACCPVREDARDVLVSPKYGTLEGLPKGARVGTSSLRRAVSILRARPDVLIVPLRGNVDTRLGKVQSGECDAILLAYAGLRRLGLGDRATEVLLPEIVLPAVGQGALGIECREDDAVSRELLQSVRHIETEVCVAAERGVMRALDGDCELPIEAPGPVDLPMARIFSWMRSCRCRTARPTGSRPDYPRIGRTFLRRQMWGLS